MAILEQLFSSGHIALIAASVLVIETAIIFLLLRGRLLIVPVLWNTLSGLGLLGALYCALSASGWMSTASFLTLGLTGHLGDLIFRLKASATKQ